MARASSVARTVADRVAEAFVEVVQRYRVGVRGEPITGRGEIGRVTSRIRHSDLVQPAAEGRVGGVICVVFFGTQDQVRVAGVTGGPPVTITDIAGRSRSDGVKVPIDEDSHLAR